MVKISFPEQADAFDCGICARVRRGALLHSARELNAQKIALGHHADDAVQTVLMNLTEGGRFRSFAPILPYPEHHVAIIRPLIYTSEQSLAHLAADRQFPVMTANCPHGECTNRRTHAELLHTLRTQCPAITQKILHALECMETADAWSNDFAKR